MMKAEEFDEIAAKHCSRWSAQTIAIVRSILVDNKKPSDVARERELNKNSVNTMKYRFLEIARRASAVKVGADEFMLKEIPAERSLEAFTADIRKLVSKGYSDQQVSDFLRLNNVISDTNELSDFIKSIKHGGNP